MVFKWHFQQYFSYIVAVSFISGENLEYQEKTRRQPPTCRKLLTNFNVVSSTSRHEWGPNSRVITKKVYGCKRIYKRDNLTLEIKLRSNLYYCSTFHSHTFIVVLYFSHIRVFNNEQNSYPKKV
jgi:hypothetical protein